MNITFVLATQYDNLGDLVINRELIKTLAKHGRVHVDVSRAPQNFCDDLLSCGGDNVIPLKTGIRSLAFYWQVFSGRFKCDAVVFPPGAQPLVIEQSLLPSWLLQVLAITLLKLKGIKICCFGVSFDVKKKNVVGLAKWRLFDSIGVRSAEAISELKSILPKVSYCPDLALLLSPKASVVSRDDWGRYAVISARKTIPGYCAPEYADQLTTACQRILGSLTDIDTAILVHQVGRDQVFMAEMAKSLRVDGKKIVLIEETLDEADLCTIYGGAEFVLSNRLHVLLLAIINGASLIALVHNQHIKLKEVLSDVGLEGTFLDTSLPESEIIANVECAAQRGRQIVEAFLARKPEYENKIISDVAAGLGRSPL